MSGCLEVNVQLVSFFFISHQLILQFFIQTWSPGANRENFAPSSVEMLRAIGETLDAFFELPIPMHLAVLPDLTVGLDRTLQLYASKVKSGCGKY
jgi:hypothetical protein